MNKIILVAMIILAGAAGSGFAVPPVAYEDGRPQASLRLNAKDQGVVFRHGVGPNQCDYLGARDVWVWQYGGTYYMHYDGAGPRGWLTCLAISKDLVHWVPRGPALDFGMAHSNDSASASYGTTYFDGRMWHMFYLGTPHATLAPDYVPAFPYLTMKAESARPAGPWKKQYDVTPFRVKANSYYAGCASPGYIIKRSGDYLMFFSASTETPIFRTLGLARTHDLNGPWTLAAQPLLPPTEQIENSSLYFEKKNKTWFLFTDHVGIKDGLEYTDAIWVYWSRDPTRWDPAHKAVVLDSSNCKWSKHIIGLPSVVPAGKRLAIFYDGQDADPIPPGVKSHMNRDIGLAWLDLPLEVPAAANLTAGVQAASAGDWAFLDDGQVRLGVKRNAGAGIGWFSESGSARNLINGWDKGRLVQQSYYGQSDGSLWDKKPWCWNPVQGGDWRGHGARVLELIAATNLIYAKTLPKHWATGVDLPDVTMEEWITLTGKVAHIRFKMTYTGTNSQPLCDQEVPAIFAQPDLDTLAVYDGKSPWTNGPLERSKPGWPNEGRHITEHWAAFLDKADFGIGALVPVADRITCYRFGDGQREHGSCSYFAPLVKFAITSGKVFEYDVYLTIGKSAEIRKVFRQIYFRDSGFSY